MEIHICSITEYDANTRVPTIVNPNSSTFYLVLTEDGTSPDLFTEWVYVNGAWEMFGSAKIDLSEYLTDVQINGTSIVQDGVANFSVANNNTFGLVKTSDVYGVGVFSGGVMYLKAPTETNIKRGNSERAIKPPQQHISTFYGLAKAAGDTTQSQSSNAVGNYTDNAKDKIQTMLGVSPLIAPHESDPFESAHAIGELFIINGKLYRAKTALAVGEYINEGINVEAVDVAEVLDDYATKEDVQDNVSIVEKSASGAVASFSDGADDIPLKSLIVNIDPVQDLHGQDTPYPAGSGKNLFDVDNPNIVEGYISDLSFSDSNYKAKTVYIPISPNTTYTVSKMAGKRFSIATSPNIPAHGISFSGRNVNNVATSITVTSGANDAYLWAWVYLQDTDTVSLNDMLASVQIEKGSTATAWSPYENICPISGWTEVDVGQSGKNIFDGNSFVSGRYDNADFSISSASDTRSAKIYLKAGSYTLSANGTSSINRRILNGAMSSAIRNLPMSFTLSADGWFGFSTTDLTSDFKLELGSTATPYEPYTGRSITINLGQTVYGGKLDVLSGELVIDRAVKVLDGTEAIISLTNAIGIYVDGIKIPTVSVVGDIICNQYKSSSQSLREDMAIYKTINNAFVVIRDSVYTIDVATYRQYLTDLYAQGSPVQFCYELATPITIQLDSHTLNSLYGVNNIWADSGDTACEYFSQVDKDLIDYIETSLKPYAKEERLNDYVDDVQIDGTSIVTNNVANVPIATQNVIGALYTASEADGKVGTHTYRAIVPKVQHSSVFYGLAKAAGVDMSSSSNTVGTYTDEAKTAIKQMLGIHDTIDSFVEDVTGTDVTITGQPSYRYNCGELYSLTVTPPSSGTIDFRFTSGSTPTVLTLPSTVKMPEWWVEVEANTIYEMCITDGIYCGVMSWAM